MMTLMMMATTAFATVTWIPNPNVESPTYGYLDEDYFISGWEYTWSPTDEGALVYTQNLGKFRGTFAEMSALEKDWYEWYGDYPGKGGLHLTYEAVTWHAFPLVAERRLTFEIDSAALQHDGEYQELFVACYPLAGHSPIDYFDDCSAPWISVVIYPPQ